MSDRPKGLAELDQIEAVFSALAHPTRRQILTVLRARGGTMTSGDLAERFDCAWATTTRHLKLLTEAGLVTVARQGRERHYRINADVIADTVGHWVNRFADDPAKPKSG